ncbi:hypothetical protein [Aliamphritea spongicola]|nr:hypothetical protein [Aliamphritea spongicola]
MLITERDRPFEVGGLLLVQPSDKRAVAASLEGQVINDAVSFGFSVFLYCSQISLL